MANGPQKPDHRGNFYMTPRSVVDCVAWRCASLRARAVLQVFQAKHTGYNNGEIALSIKQIGAFLGDQCHGANAKAVAELIELGFVECTSDAMHGQSKARTYRLTFVSTGNGKQTPATKEYEMWRPTPGSRKAFGGARSAAHMKFGSAVTATQEAESDAVTATLVKFHDAVTATGVPGIADFSNDSSVAVTAALIGNHSPPLPGHPLVSGISSQIVPDSIAADFGELREWLRNAIAAMPYGGAKALAKDAGIPEATLSRFRNGKTMKESYRLKLHEACARVLPRDKWKAAA